MAAFEEQDAVAVIAFEEVPRPRCSATALPAPSKTAEVFEVADLIEKPNQADAPSNLAIAARYVLSPAIFACAAPHPPRQGRRDSAHRRHPAPDP